MDTAAAIQDYLRAGEARAAALGNRGPIRFNADGSLHADIVEANWRCGFYVFEGVLGADELADIEADVLDIIGCGIDARHQRFPDEMPYVYKPFSDAGVVHQWNDTARADLKDYNLLDLSI